MQVDPTDYPDGMNRFECLRSNPLTGIDPYGLQKIELKVKEDESDHGSTNWWEAQRYGAMRDYGDPPPKVSGNVANLNVWSLAKGIGTCSSNSNVVQAKVTGSGGTVTLNVRVHYALMAHVSEPGDYGGSASAHAYVLGLNLETLDWADTPPTRSNSQPFEMSNMITGDLDGKIEKFPCGGEFRSMAKATDDATINKAGPPVESDPKLRRTARRAVVKGHARVTVAVTIE